MASARPTPAVFRRRRLVALAVLLAAVVVAALLLRGGADERSRQPPAPRAAAAKPVELPRGGRRLLPDRRIVAFYGAPQSEELGELGIGSPASAARRLERQARAYAQPSRPVLPAMELIAVTAAAHPGEGGRYSTRQDDAVIERYLRAARRAKALLVLDIQPGRSDFYTEATRLERWLAEPDVGLALDPEWRMAPDQVPGKVIGSVDAREVNAVSAWLAGIVERNKLPQKLLLIHQFTDDMVDDTQLRERPQLAMVLNADGFGSQELKRVKYHAFTASPRPFFHTGFKLFYREDTDLMRPREVLRLRPPPDVVVYE
ncbi:MAG TPA: hypothetical protein VEX67_13375 [Solirubrobacteraceae bacterium]|nr:hypothetical protein [Solirubrobacteraceae bacterium]